MMSENVMVPPPLFHQRSHSMPVGQHAFINGGPNGVDNRTYDFKRSSPLKNDTTPTTEVAFPLPIPTKSLASQLSNNDSSAASINSNNNDNTSRNKGEPNFFCNPKTVLNLFDYNRKITNCPIIFNCKMDRGFFTSQSHWTCYRRNYFQVTASFMIPGHTEGTCYALQLNSDKPMQPIQQFFLRLKACTSAGTATTTGEDTNGGGGGPILENHATIRPVALTQMTPKRDKGPQREPPIIPISPSSSSTDLYNNNSSSNNSNSNDQVCVTFERLQFRVATANNGKRRASQQYFRLIFELIAQLADDQQSQHVVAECYSSPLVVRGRSPGHYSSEAASSNTTPQQQHRPHPNTENGTTSTKRKRKMTPSSSPSSSTTDDNNNVVNNKREKHTHNGDEGTTMNSNNFTLPPPQYVYGTSPMVIEQQHRGGEATIPPPPLPTTSSTTSTSSSSYSIMPIMTPTSYGAPPPPTNNTGSAFSNFHHRSQSANDSEFYARQQRQQAIKYNHGYHQQQQHWDDYEVGMARALRNWQQQVIHQRTDSAATYDSFDNSKSTRPGTPIPYNSRSEYQQQSHNGGWQQHHSAATSPHLQHQQQQHYSMESNGGNNEEKLNCHQQQASSPHDTKLYNN